MAYTPYYSAWQDYPNVTTPITAAALQNIEDELVNRSTGVFNVLDYGAVADGATDDSAAIQDAIDAASAAATAIGGGVRAQVLIPAGDYLLTYWQDRTFDLRLPDLSFATALFTRDNVDIVGIGHPRLIADYHDVTAGISQCIFASIEGTAVSNWSIRGLVIDGGGIADEHTITDSVAFPDATEAFFGIDAQYANNFEIVDNKFTGIFGDAIFATGAATRVSPAPYLGPLTDFLIADNHFTICNGQVCSITAATRFVIRNNLCYDSQAAGGGGTETMIIGGDSTTTAAGFIHGNAMDKWGSIANYGGITNSSNLVFSGNLVRPIHGLLQSCVIGGTGNVFANNVVDLAFYAADASDGISGIYAVTCSAPTITGNQVIFSPGGTRAASTHRGINCVAANAVVVGNSVRSSSVVADAMIDILSIGTDNVISNNRCNASQSSISVSGVRSKVSGNICDGAFAIGAAGATTATYIQCVGNHFAATFAGATSSLVVCGKYNRIANNTIDISLSTNNGIWFRQGSNHFFEHNTVIGKSGAAAFFTDAGHTDGDLFVDNILLGGATWGLGAANFFQRSPGAVTTLTYSGTIATDALTGNLQRITATNGTAFTISNPTGKETGMELVYDIKNSSGGALGLITWGGAFLLAGAFTNPANGKRRTIEFYYDGTNWVEVNRAAADI